MRAWFELVRTQDGRIRGRIDTEAPLGTALGWDGRLSEPQEYLGDPRSVSWHGSYSGSFHLRGIKLAAQVPNENGHVTRLLEYHFDLTPGCAERALLDALIAQDECEVLWVNENVGVGNPDWPGLSSTFDRELAVADSLLAKRWCAKPKPRPRNLPYWAKHPGSLDSFLEASGSNWNLPRGRRGPDYWVSRSWVPEVALVADRISRAFADTGIWPLLWLFEEEPEAYSFGGGEDPTLADEIDVNQLLDRDPAESAPASRRPPAHPQLMPFRRLPSDIQARLLLVPCQRPADAIVRIGGLGCEIPSDDMTAVLREWERLYGAVLVAMEPSHAWLAIEAPPDHAEATRAAREFLAFCPLPDDLSVEDVAERMASEGRDGSVLWTVNRRLWPVGSYD